MSARSRLTQRRRRDLAASGPAFVSIRICDGVSIRNVTPMFLPVDHSRLLQTGLADFVERGFGRRTFAGGYTRGRSPLRTREDEAGRDCCNGQEADTQEANKNLLSVLDRVATTTTEPRSGSRCVLALRVPAPVGVFAVRFDGILHLINAQQAAAVTSVCNLLVKLLQRPITN